MNDKSGLDYQETIIDVLLAGPKTREDLKKEVSNRFGGRGFSDSSYHYNLKQLIKRGEVEDAKYSYKGQRVSDAVIEEVLRPITAGTDAQAIELSKNLEYLAGKPGIALKPLFLAKIDDCLASSLAEVRRFALSALSTMLWRLSETAEDRRAKEIINRRFLDTMIRIARNDAASECRGDAIKILAGLGDPSAIDVLIEIVKSISDQDYQKLRNELKQTIVWPYDPTRRPRNYLTRYHHAKILLKLSELAAKGSTTASELASMIRRGER